MSRRTVAFRRKVGQQLRKTGSVDILALVPTSDVKSPGRKNRFASEDLVDDEGRKVRAGKHGRPIKTDAICTRRMSDEKVSRLSRFAK
jgi:hypothetical protein